MNIEISDASMRGDTFTTAMVVGSWTHVRARIDKSVFRVGNEKPLRGETGR